MTAYSRQDRTISGIHLLEKLGDSLREIKRDDRLTDADLGRVLGKHADSVATYRSGDGDMGVVSFLFGCKEWDGRFANPVLRHLGVKMVRVPQVLASRADLLALLARKSREVSDLTTAIITGLSDGVFSQADARLALREAHELLDVLLAMIAELEAIEAGETR
ncbi:hypothetical protein [uncultured Sphingomonas sp.]|uniref:hypothetical protein n=1 Tax=uncultured Sphingomonas sp. TaxID=158754 RepID=UPI0025CE83C9|nr:hypothetical protein [uncultured Sphingomonas sp.]